MKTRPVGAQPTPQIQQQLRTLWAQAQQAQHLFQAYAQGVKDALGLVGEYTLDAATMTFKREAKPADKPADKPE